MEIPNASKYSQGSQQKKKVRKYPNNFQRNARNIADPGSPNQNTSESWGYLVAGLIIGGLVGFGIGGPVGALVLATIGGFVGKWIETLNK